MLPLNGAWRLPRRSSHGNSVSARIRSAFVFLLIFITGSYSAHADPNSPQDRAAGVLGLMSFILVPDPTTSALTLSRATGASDLSVYQIGGDTNWRSNKRLYIEGYVGYGDYRPDFNIETPTDSANVEAKWANYGGTVGVGWDFPLAKDLVFRPIGNFSLARLDSNASAFGLSTLSGRSGEADFLENGTLNAVGFGASAMLDYERYREDHEVDVELRLTSFQLETIGGTSSAVKGSATAGAVSLWTRLRVPSGYIILDRPFRVIMEAAHSQFLGDQRNAIGPNYLTQIGGGFEIDTSTVNDVVNRARITLRYVFGEDYSGTSLGLGITF